MATLDILVHPNPRLRQVSTVVEEVSQEVRDLIRDLRHTMFSKNGAGIAAMQVGRSEALFLIDGRTAGLGEKAEPLVFLNPEILQVSEETEVGLEGCLSMPGQEYFLRRPLWVKVRARTEDFGEFEVGASGFFARAILHEYDHLHGRMMTDLLPRWKRPRG